MPILYRVWYSIGMSYYDVIYEQAVDNNYLFTTDDARETGIPVVELAKLAHRGRLESLGNGVYRLARYVPSEADPFAVAVARAGKGAFLYGESVIALLGLAPTNPERIYVATTRRVRKALPPNVVLLKLAEPERLVRYSGVPAQRVANAIIACKRTIMVDRLREAAKRGREAGYITSGEAGLIGRELGCP